MALTHEGFAYVGSDANVAAWNHALTALCGITPERAVGNDVRRLFTNGQAIVQVPFDGTVRDLRVGYETREGLRWMHVSVVAVNLDASTHGWLCSFGPERRYREIEQLKNEIVAAVSHELKTPIASIKAFATTLRENPDAIGTQRDEFLSVIDEQADRLTRAVDDLLMASRVEVEQLLQRRVPVPLDEVIDAALRSLSAEERGAAIVRETRDVILSGDPELLREILRHLIENAIKFSPAGRTITVEGEFREDSTVVHVRDNGIGIADEHLPYIFDRFYRVEHELTAQVGGNGLGLFIVEALVRAHGGRISVTSEPEVGTTFTIFLPARSS
jgi:two-component system, OmpR family, phosphate regulon sensor histidine kinase PhoR